MYVLRWFNYIVRNGGGPKVILIQSRGITSKRSFIRFGVDINCIVNAKGYCGPKCSYMEFLSLIYGLKVSYMPVKYHM